jgi:hypothetical protein
MLIKTTYPMVFYKTLHIRNLLKHKKFCEIQIKHYNEWLIEINKELKHYES